MILSIVLLCVLSGVLSGVLHYQKKIIPQIKFTWAHVPSFSEFNKNILQYNTPIPESATDKLQTLTTLFTEYQIMSDRHAERCKKIEQFFESAWFSQLIVAIVLNFKFSMLFTFNSVLESWVSFGALIASCTVGILISNLFSKSKQITYEDVAGNDSNFHALQLNDYPTVEEYINAEYDRCSEFVGDRIDCLYECMAVTKNTLTICWTTIAIVYFFVVLLAMW